MTETINFAHFPQTLHEVFPLSLNKKKKKQNRMNFTIFSGIFIQEGSTLMLNFIQKKLVLCSIPKMDLDIRGLSSKKETF